MRYRISHSTVERCVEFGKAIVHDYRTSSSLGRTALAMNGIEAHVGIQAHAKMCECVGALADAQTPTTALDWSIGVADTGFDFVARNGRKIDVKGVDRGKRFLLWPKSKIGIYAGKQFDAFILVVGNAPIFEVVGWIAKHDFLVRRHIASQGHRLETGTWYLDRDELNTDFGRLLG